MIDMVFAFSIADVLSQWESVGVFDYLLPFLLIFAVIYGILSATNMLGGNRGINIIIAIVIGFMALRLEFVSLFFSEVFPRLGVGVAIILTLLILVGLFIPDKERQFWMWGLGAIGFITAIIVVTRSLDQFGWIGSGVWDSYAGYIIGAVLLVGLIIAVGASGGDSKDKKGKDGAKALGEALFNKWRD